MFDSFIGKIITELTKANQVSRTEQVLETTVSQEIKKVKEPVPVVVRKSGRVIPVFVAFIIALCISLIPLFRMLAELGSN